MGSVVDKYLERYAEGEARAVMRALADLAHGAFEVSVVVPLCGERSSFLAGLAAAAQATPGLLSVIVVNAELGAGEAVVAANQVLLADLERAATEQRDVAHGVRLLTHPVGQLLIIDRGHAPDLLPPKTGVGLARKLGSDVVLGLWRAGVVRSPWIYHCDADTTLPAGHFQRPMPSSGAVSFPFAHVPSGQAEVDRATFEYEARLRYHLLGLRYAGSPFAYHSLGSSLAVHTVSYAQVRGFPKRAAGEDFYLLDKVNKLDRVHTATGDVQRIAARRSTRVPFGTGASVEKLLGGEPLRVDAPAAYDVLRQLYQHLDQVIAAHSVTPLLNWLAAPEQAAVCAVARTLGAQPAFEEAVRQTRTASDLRLRVDGWFDGLKALRLLHGLRTEYPALGLSEALAAAPFVPSEIAAAGGDSAAFWIGVCEQLRAHEVVTAPEL